MIKPDRSTCEYSAGDVQTNSPPGGGQCIYSSCTQNRTQPVSGPCCLISISGPHLVLYYHPLLSHPHTLPACLSLCYSVGRSVGQAFNLSIQADACAGRQASACPACSRVRSIVPLWAATNRRPPPPPGCPAWAGASVCLSVCLFMSLSLSLSLF